MTAVGHDMKFVFSDRGIQLSRMRVPWTRGATSGALLVIDGLWGLAFGNGVQHQPTDTLFFTAGPGEESHGLFGKIEAP